MQGSELAKSQVRGASGQGTCDDAMEEEGVPREEGLGGRQLS